MNLYYEIMKGGVIMTKEEIEKRKKEIDELDSS